MQPFWPHAFQLAGGDVRTSKTAIQWLMHKVSHYEMILPGNQQHQITYLRSNGVINSCGITQKNNLPYQKGGISSLVT